MSKLTLKEPTVFLPFAISLVCLAMVIIHAAVYGLGGQADEGTAARFFQLLMLAQVPIVVLFAVKWLPRAPKLASFILALQLAAAASAMAAVNFFERFAQPR